MALLRRILQISTDLENSIVLDFFSGSGTTAQAVLELNREDGGNRKFILVQLPEPTENKQFPTISSIGMERIRRVIAKLKGETGNLSRSEPEDLGMKVFRLTESHYSQWTGTADRTVPALVEQMRLIETDPLRHGWTAEGMLWELALKAGYGLNSVFKKVGNTTTTVWRVENDLIPGQSFLVCLADQIPPDIAKQLELGPDDKLVVRDNALDDTLAANLALQCRLEVV